MEFISINTTVNLFSRIYNLIIKLHPLDLEKYQYKEKEGVIYETEFISYDLVKIADKIITDYSSLAVEVSLLNKPIYFYTYDIETYKQSPGLNFDFEKEPINLYQSTNVDELLIKLQQNYDLEILKQFKNKYISIDTKDCTEKLTDFIMEEMK